MPDIERNNEGEQIYRAGPAVVDKIIVMYWNLIGI